MQKKSVIFAAIVLLFAGACASDEGREDITAASPDTSAPAPSPADVACADLTGQASGAPIEMMDSPFRFDPACAKIMTTQDFHITNAGAVTHNFSIENVAAVDVDTAPGQTNQYDAPGLQPGTYTFFCKFHRASGMEGELQVQ